MKKLLIGLFAVSFTLSFIIGCADDDDDNAENFDSTLEITGSYMDTYGSMHQLSADTWTTVSPSAVDGGVSSTSVVHITNIDNGSKYLVGQNDKDNTFSPNLWSKYNWVSDSANLYYCQIAFDAATKEAALDVTNADSSDLIKGCNSFAWSKLISVKK